MLTYKVSNVAGEWRVKVSKNNGLTYRLLRGTFETKELAEKAIPRKHAEMTKPLGIPEMVETDRPTRNPKTCNGCGTPDLHWKEHEKFGWKLFDPVLDDFHNCLNINVASEFDPCPQCGTAFCKCENVTTEEEDDATL